MVSIRARRRGALATRLPLRIFGTWSALVIASGCLLVSSVATADDAPLRFVGRPVVLANHSGPSRTGGWLVVVRFNKPLPRPHNAAAGQFLIDHDVTGNRIITYSNTHYCYSQTLGNSAPGPRLAAKAVGDVVTITYRSTTVEGLSRGARIRRYRTDPRSPDSEQGAMKRLHC